MVLEVGGINASRGAPGGVHVTVTNFSFRHGHSSVNVTFNVQQEPPGNGFELFLSYGTFHGDSMLLERKSIVVGVDGITSCVIVFPLTRVCTSLAHSSAVPWPF
jgi:hypothetical protein